MELILVCLKVLGVLISGVFGLLGAVVKIRDDQGVFSSRGKIFIAGSILGFLMAVISQIIEGHVQHEAAKKTEQEALQATIRLERINRELNRSLQPITSFEVYFSGNKISMADEVFANYKKRLEKGFSTYLKKTDRERFLYHEITAPVTTKKNGRSEPLILSVSEDSSFFPSNKEFLLKGLIFPICYEFVFFKNPIDPSAFQPGFHDALNNGDFRVRAFMPNGLDLQKDLRSGDYQVAGKVIFKKELWTDITGQIVSIPDLAGAQMFFSACVPFQQITSIFTKEELRRAPADVKLEPGSMNFHLGARSFWVRGEKLIKYNGRLRQYWEYKFPEDVSDIFKSTP